MKEITSLQHPLVKHLVRLVHNRGYRYEHNAVIVEGSTIIKEICSNNPAKLIITSDPHLIPHEAKSAEIYLVTPAILRKIASSEEPEGILAEIDMPQAQSLQGFKKVIALDGVSDPGNVGTLLRTALALGWEGAFLLPHCADPYNDKAMRASRGAPFKLPILQGTWQELAAMIKINKWKVLGADIHGKHVNEIALKEPTLLIFGSEAHGLSEQVEQCCEKVTIPMPGNMESLNVAVAGGILMFSLRG